MLSVEEQMKQNQILRNSKMLSFWLKNTKIKSTTQKKLKLRYRIFTGKTNTTQQIYIFKYHILQLCASFFNQESKLFMNYIYINNIINEFYNNRQVPSTPGPLDLFDTVMCNKLYAHGKGFSFHKEFKAYICKEYTCIYSMIYIARSRYRNVYRCHYE